MKKTTYAFLAVIAVATVSCSKGVREDASTGMFIHYKGFDMGDAYLVGAGNNRMRSNKVPVNSKVAIVVEGINNYVLKDGRAFPGLSLRVTDAKGKSVIDEADLLVSVDGYPAADAAILRGTVTVGNPMKSGQTYHARMRIWDKNKPKHQIIDEVDLDII